MKYLFLALVLMPNAFAANVSMLVYDCRAHDSDACEELAVIALDMALANQNMDVARHLFNQVRLGDPGFAPLAVVFEE